MLNIFGLLAALNGWRAMLRWIRKAVFKRKEDSA